MLLNVCQASVSIRLAIIGALDHKQFYVSDPINLSALSRAVSHSHSPSDGRWFNWMDFFFFFRASIKCNKNYGWFVLSLAHLISSVWTSNHIGCFFNFLHSVCVHTTFAASIYRQRVCVLVVVISIMRRQNIRMRNIASKYSLTCRYTWVRYSICWRPVLKPSNSRFNFDGKASISHVKFQLIQCSVNFALHDFAWLH